MAVGWTCQTTTWNQWDIDRITPLSCQHPWTMIYLLYTWLRRTRTTNSTWPIRNKHRPTRCLLLQPHLSPILANPRPIKRSKRLIWSMAFVYIWIQQQHPRRHNNSHRLPIPSMEVNRRWIRSDLASSFIEIQADHQVRFCTRMRLRMTIKIRDRLVHCIKRRTISSNSIAATICLTDLWLISLNYLLNRLLTIPLLLCWPVNIPMWFRRQLT